MNPPSDRDKSAATTPGGADSEIVVGAALQAVPGGVSVWSDDFRLMLFNRRFAEMNGIDPGALHAGLEIDAFCGLSIAAGNYPGTSPEELAREYRQIAPTVQPGSPVKRVSQLGGRTIRSTIDRIEGVGWTASNEDITEDATLIGVLRGREAQLERQNLRLDAAVNTMGRGLVMLDADLRLVICNAACARLYKLPPDLVRPGTAFKHILEYQVASGLIEPEPGEDHV
ncbi:MAG TPA: PAS-domain containing protein, partial [Devosiaceae bacterium]|nr:PAS-domain containing protein [Devosiaceae bacterium]